MYEELSGPTEPSTAISLDDAAAALDPAVRAVLPAGAAESRIRTVTLAEASDLAAPTPLSPLTDLILPVGVTAELAERWLAGLHERHPEARPVALIIKEDIDTPEVRAAAAKTGLGLVIIDRLARWDLMLTAIHRRLERAQSPAASIPGGSVNAAFVDLAELAMVIAEGAGGMVTIERPDSSVLAYSPSDGTADELRARAILGRVAPEDSMVLLGEWGVVRQIQHTREVVAVAAHEELGMRPRLVTGIHDTNGHFIGSIWVQEGAHGFAPDAETVVRGGASAAARILTREREAPSASEMMLQRVFGEHGGIDSSTAAAFLRLPALGDAAVMGIEIPPNQQPRSRASTGPSSAAWGTGVSPGAGSGAGAGAGAGAGSGGGSGSSSRPGRGRGTEKGADTSLGADTSSTQGKSTAKLLRLHIGAFAPTARFVIVGDRAYVLLPNLPTGHRLQEWAEQLVNRFDSRDEASGLRIAIVSPVDGFAEVSRARTEADRVLDAISGSSTRVTSLRQSRTSVLLRETFDLLSERAELTDPRLETLAVYDSRHRADLIPTLRSYVDAGYNAREAARRLGVHPNTLRYRLGRAEDLTGYDLSQADDRLLIALQLSLFRNGRN